jgi:hypothetical protein
MNQFIDFKNANNRMKLSSIDLSIDKLYKLNLISDNKQTKITSLQQLKMPFYLVSDRHYLLILP